MQSLNSERQKSVASALALTSSLQVNKQVQLGVASSLKFIGVAGRNLILNISAATVLKLVDAFKNLVSNMHVGSAAALTNKASVTVIRRH